ncbi:hypothetical protein [Micromonospora sp. KC606]|nr:hypothetical protein [Micromonospora sp. KC606]
MIRTMVRMPARPGCGAVVEPRRRAVIGLTRGEVDALRRNLRAVSGSAT